MSISAPKPTGDILGPADILGHLLVVIPTEFCVNIPTVRGESDAIRVDVAVLTQTDAAGNHGVVYRDALWFNVLLRGSLKKQLGETVLARMAQGQGKPGQDPPFILTDATTDAQALAFAEQWLAANPEFETVAMNSYKQANGVSGGVTSPAQAAPTPAVPSVPSVPAAVAVPSPVAQPGMGGQAVPATPAVPAVPAAAPTPAVATPSAADMLAALNPDERAKLMAMLGQQ